MKMNNRQKALLILAIYLAATLALLAFGYAVQAPKVRQQEFPFSITYTFASRRSIIIDFQRKIKCIGTIRQVLS